MADKTIQQLDTERRTLAGIAANEKTAQIKQLAEEAPKPIGEKEIAKALDTLKKYKAGKHKLEQKIIANEEFWKQRQWKYIGDKDNEDRFEPATPWLFSCIQSRYSDTMDSYPTCNIQPRQQDDKGEAKILSQIIPVILDQCDYEETYSDIAWYMLKHGGCVQGVYWDKTLHNGLGDVAIKKIDFLNLFWEPGITDIQKSANVFHTELVDNDVLLAMYPECEGKLGGKPVNVEHYLYDDTVDTTDKSVVVDWYYKKPVNGKMTLQYVKFVNNVLLYATENDSTVPTNTTVDPATGMSIEQVVGVPVSQRGLYDHAKYPFVVQQLFPIEGSLCGYGLTDIGRDSQIEIDLINRAITENAIAAAKPRYFIVSDGRVNEKEFTDMDKTVVHVEGSINDAAIAPITTVQLNGNYIEVMNQKIQELKYCTSNQDVNNGSAPSGITAGSAISALQETAGKNARSSNKAFHRAYKEVVTFVIELIRQFYDTPRTFRICPDTMIGEQYIDYSNMGIRPQQQFGLGGQDMGLRLPEFDVSVTTEKANPYKKMEINELALNFYGNGFFNPQMTDQAIATLQMMDFDQKDEIIQRIQQNGTIYEKLLQYEQLALQLAQMLDPKIAESLAKDMQGNGQPVLGGVTQLASGEGEHPYNTRARAQARNSTQAD